MKYPNIETERQKAGITQKQFAAILGVSPATIRKWHEGTADIPAGKLSLMARFFGASADYLIGRTQSR